MRPAPVNRHAGGCHCGALRFEFATSRALGEFAPRACDCDYCTRHRAGWVSDASGSLRIEADKARLRRYRQGSGQADFLLCAGCGVLVAVVARAGDGRLLGAANRNAFDERTAFMAETTVSPQQLDPATKLARWTQLWTPVALEPRA
jgi:hypothetical protein